MQRNYNGGALEYNQDLHRQSTYDWCASTGGNTAAFDFTTKGILQEAVRNREYWRLQGSDGHPSGFCGWRPTHAVTFSENHDTGSTLQHWPFPTERPAEGYAYILTHQHANRVLRTTGRTMLAAGHPGADELAAAQRHRLRRRRAHREGGGRVLRRAHRAAARARRARVLRRRRRLQALHLHEVSSDWSLNQNRVGGPREVQGSGRRCLGGQEVPGPNTNVESRRRTAACGWTAVENENERASFELPLSKRDQVGAAGTRVGRSRRGASDCFGLF